MFRAKPQRLTEGRFSLVQALEVAQHRAERVVEIRLMRRGWERHAEQLFGHLQPALVPGHPSEQVKRLGVVTVAQQDMLASLLGCLPSPRQVVVFGKPNRFVSVHSIHPRNPTRQDHCHPALRHCRGLRRT
jgi:hypothetical protein